ncbi:MAG: hypothetical protein Q9205_005278 [Flavoplaca limonia]
MNIYTHPLPAHSNVQYLPLHLKELLLTYLARYRLIGLTLDQLQDLLAESNDNATGDPSDRIRTNIKHLDLSHSIGSSLSCDELDRAFAFTSLTHLCLANPGTKISWSSLLTLSRNQPDLTHLSLAYWPMASPSPEDSDRVSATLQSLSSLSSTLTKLQYLDLEGCSEWISILLSDQNHRIDWSGEWKHVQCLNLSQGPMPIAISLEGGQAMENWIQGEVVARQVGDNIDNVRKCVGKLDVPPVRLEHGWSPDNFMIKFLVDRAYERSRMEGSSHATATDAPTGRFRGPGL